MACQASQESRQSIDAFIVGPHLLVRSSTTTWLKRLPRERLHGMKSFFEPKSIGVAGVSTDPDKLGSIIFSNLVENSKKGLLRASVYALNPAHERIGDNPCYPSISALPEIPELLVIAVPESQTVALVKSAAEAGVKAAAIITGGYAEVGRGEAEKQIGKLAAKHGMRILGPNTIGLVDTWSGVDSLFLRQTKRLPNGEEIVSMLKPLRGEVAIITQSGHLGEVIAEELAANGVGIRALVGTGNQADVSIEDVVEYFGADQKTKVIAVYLEGVRDGKRFMETAAAAVKKKPVIAFKVGKSTAGARAALTHTASIVGDYEVYRAAFGQSGIIEARSLQELIDFVISLLMLPRSTGNRLVIITNAGGVGAIAADEAARLGLRVEPPGPRARRMFKSEYGTAGFAANASLGNPIDLTASVTSDEFVKAVGLFTAQPQYDLALVLPTHQAPGMGPDVAERLADVIAKCGKPVACSVIGSSPLASRIYDGLMARRIPSYLTPEQGVSALAAMSRYVSAKASAREKTTLGPGIRRIRQGAGPLAQEEIGDLLRSYGILQPRSVMVRSRKDLAKLRRLRFPVACKLISPSIIHKSDVGGVATDVRDEGGAGLVFGRFEELAAEKRVPFGGVLVQEMARGVELILGGLRDPTFGPVLMVGLGGTNAELLREFRLAVAPVSPKQALRILVSGKLGAMLKVYRGSPAVDVGSLSRIVSNFSHIMVQNPHVDQMEVNPLMASGKGALAVDTRVVLSGR